MCMGEQAAYCGSFMHGDGGRGGAAAPCMGLAAAVTGKAIE